MHRARNYAWTLVAVASGLLAFLLSRGLEHDNLFGGIDRDVSLADVIFWVLLLASTDLLPVSLGYKSEITMAFPLVLSTAILFHPALAMIIRGLGLVDLREFHREIPLYQALFNRAQEMITAGAGSLVIDAYPGNPFTFPEGAIALSLAAATLLFLNLGLVAIWLNRAHGMPVLTAAVQLIPQPATGFWASQVLVAGLGIATAAAYLEVGAFVAAFLIPLLFARLGILGARAQQELSERLQKQQQALLAASEQVFAERENERKRIAADIHDSSLQLLAAARYGINNAQDYLRSGSQEKAEHLLETTNEAIEDAITGLRASLVDLRRSSVESGGLMETIRAYVDQVSMLWGSSVVVEGDIEHEPPAPVALAAFQILQEGLVNALKHAESDSIRVRVLDKENMVHIVVEDDGPGFDPEAEVGSEHVGMRLMKERAALVGGRIELTSAKGVGTRLEAVLPGGLSG